MIRLLPILLILLSSCAREPEDQIPVINIVDVPDSDYYYHYKLVAKEPLPYPVTVHRRAVSRGIGALPGDPEWRSEFLDGDIDFITVTPDTNEYIGSYSRVLEHNKDRNYVKIVTSVEIEIRAITDIEIFNYFPESEKERVYTVGQSTLTLGSRLPPWKE